MSVASDDLPPPSLSATSPLGLGEIIGGKYRVERLLGAGGMGLVLAATHTELDQRVAIKMMREEALRDPDSRARFAREAKAAVRLKSEHVARVLDVGTLDTGAPFLVMEFLQGCDLATVLEERGALPVAEAVACLLQVCEAVAEAHGAGIIHRDLKPRNIFVTTGVDGKPLLKVLDFGISKLVLPTGAVEDHSLTKTTDIMGSPSYMAPEQMRSARDADERADIWSLGVILFELVTGRLPWEAESISELGAMVLRDPPRSMRELRPEIPPALEAVILGCLEKQRVKRYPTVSELAHALEPFALGLGAVSAERITSVARTSKQPPASRPSMRDRPSSSSSRVMVSGGTSVSWGETELMGPKLSIPPKLRSRTGMMVIAGCLLLGAVAGGGYAASRSMGPNAQAPAPVLPEDRAAIRAPAPNAPNASVNAPTALVPVPPTTGLPVANSSASPATSASSLANVPRRSAAPNGAPSTAAPSATAERPAAPAAPSPPKAPDAHDFGAIPRK